MQKYYREAFFRKSMHFITFTYSPDTLPINVFAYDQEGNLFRFDEEVNEDNMREVRNSWQEDDNHHGRLFFSNGAALCGFSSLCRRDVRLFIKRWRVDHPGIEFSFSIIGEYGKRGRPHYHGVFFGLSDDLANDLTRSWDSQFGFALCKSIPLVSDNDDIVGVSRYVAKYMHKGLFEAQNVLDGFSERPRPFSSVRLGEGANFAQLRRWYLALDRFPSVSIHDTSFSNEYLDLVESRMSTFSLGGAHVQPISPALKNKFLKYVYINPLSQKRYLKSSNLALALASRVQSRIDAQSEAERKLLFESLDSRPELKDSQRLAEIQSYFNSLDLVLEDREKNSQKIYAQSLSKSKL